MSKTFTALVAFPIQNRPEIPSWRKQSWIPWRTISWWKASLPPQKESWAFFWTFSFHFLSFNGVFLSLKCRTLVLKLLHGDRAAAIVLKIDIFYRVKQIRQIWRILRQNCSDDSAEVTERVTSTPEIFGKKHSFVLTFFATNTICVNCKRCKP